ncbi:MT-A70 family methyltransferase [Sphingorhabdus sp.]|uniref:MT-A70 family methyltransferase n=1 Tax=Sphingorhabdus sp. TaxID=1902408 RepID=UPI0037C5E37A
MVNKSGYSVYNPDAKVRTRHNTLEEVYPTLPDEKYDIIYADPPWDYGGKMQFDLTSKKDFNKGFEKKIFISAANFKYPTVKTKELMRLPVESIAADDCLLFMWATNPHLKQAIELGTAWGFEYKTVAFVWDKMVHNPGQYTLSHCELCLVFKRGKIPRPRGARNVHQLVHAPRSKHSEKPNKILTNIDLMFPSQRKIELFARRRSVGWSVWGLDVIYDNALPLLDDSEPLTKGDQLSLLG